MKRILVIVLVLLVTGVFYSFAPANKNGYHIRTVVIDAGHGGHDTGCLGKDAREKNVALAVSLKLGRMIEERFPDVKVIYTRKTDVFVELRERADIANRNHADLFICVHCNSGGKAAYGVETYVMGLHKTDDNLNVSKRENSSILLEKDYKTKYDGYDPNSPESNIIFNLYQNAYMEKSLTFASKVQAQVEEAGRFNRGVKQAGFLVLYKTAMPSVLIETGFLTNSTEENFLDSEKGQVNISNAIFKAFKEYKVDMEEGDRTDTETGKAKDTIANKKAVVIINQDSIDKKNAADAAAAEIKEKAKKADAVSNNKTNDKKNVSKTEKPAPAIDARTDIKVDKPAIDSSTNKSSTTVEVKKTEEKKPEEKKAEQKTSEVKVPEVKMPEPKPQPIAEKKPVQPSAEKPVDDFFYTVQVGASPSVSESELKKYSAVRDMKVIASEDGKMQRITSGKYTTYTQAVTAQNKLRSSGFADAYVTPYNQGKRITIKDAKALGK